MRTAAVSTKPLRARLHTTERGITYLLASVLQAASPLIYGQGRRLIPKRAALPGSPWGGTRRVRLLPIWRYLLAQPRPARRTAFTAVATAVA